jgi:hypothetical protein
MIIRPVGVELFIADGQTGMTKPIVDFCNFPTAYTNTKCRSIQRIERHAPAFKLARDLARSFVFSIHFSCCNTKTTSAKKPPFKTGAYYGNEGSPFRLVEAPQTRFRRATAWIESP